MAEMLQKTASGVTHERFATNLCATIKTQVRLNKRLTEGQRRALEGEADTIGARKQQLCEANRPYRLFLDGALVEVRAGQRVANFLCDEAQRDAVALARRHPKPIAQSLAGGVASLWTEKIPSKVMRLGHAATVEATRHTARQLRLVPTDVVREAAEVARGLEEAADGLNALNDEARRIAGERVPLRFAVDKAIVELRGEIDLMKARLAVAGCSDELIDSLFPEIERGGNDAADEDAEPVAPAVPA